MHKASPKILLKNTLRAFKLMWGWFPGRIIGISAVVVAVSITTFLSSASQAFLVNELVASAELKRFSPMFLWAAGVFLAMLVFPRLLYAARSYLFRMFRFYAHQRGDLLQLQKRGEIDIAHWENPKQHDLFLLVQENEYRFYNFFDRIFDAAEQLLQVVLAAIIMVAFKWWSLPLLLVCIIPEFIVETKYGKRVWGIWNAKAETKRRYRSFERHFYRVENIIELKLYQNVAHFLSELKRLYDSFMSEQITNERRRFWYSTGGFFFSYGGIVVIAAFFISDVVSGALQVGTFLFVVGAARELRGSLSQFFITLAGQYQDSYFVSEMFRFLDLPPALPVAASPVVLLQHTTPSIVFDRVSFTYPHALHPSLEGVSFTIAPGEKVALVGKNGAGKSTIVKLLCRFYDPTEGRILVGGYDLREIDRESWHEQLAALFQDYSHYAMPVSQAIAVGRTSSPFSQERVERAAEASGASAFIRAWDDGYEQMLTKEFPGGVEPSVGQWQKLALSRLFYREARVIILDEPTSSIDPEAEEQIFEKLETLSADKTVLLISHRFSTVRRANKILVVDGGKLVEEGTHAELLKREGMYAHLFKLQAKGYA